MKYIKSIHSLKVSKTEGRSKRWYIKIRQPSKFADKVSWLEPAQRKRL